MKTIIMKIKAIDTDLTARIDKHFPTLGKILSWLKKYARLIFLIYAVLFIIEAVLSYWQNDRSTLIMEIIGLGFCFLVLALIPRKHSTQSGNSLPIILAGLFFLAMTQQVKAQQPPGPKPEAKICLGIAVAVIGIIFYLCLKKVAEIGLPPAPPKLPPAPPTSWPPPEWPKNWSTNWPPHNWPPNYPTNWPPVEWPPNWPPSPLAEMDLPRVELAGEMQDTTAIAQNDTRWLDSDGNPFVGYYAATILSGDTPDHLLPEAKLHVWLSSGYVETVIEGVCTNISRLGAETPFLGDLRKDLKTPKQRFYSIRQYRDTEVAK
jgi:hypothetical protein